MIRMMRIGLSVLALMAISAAGSGAAQPSDAEPRIAATGGVADPLRFVRAAYDLDLASPDRPGPVGMLDQDKPEYSPRLRHLFALQQREHGVDEVGRLNFNIFTGTQDGDVENIRIEQADVDYAVPLRRTVTATFSIFGRPTKMRFYFEKIGERWYLDDIASTGFVSPDEFPAWTLSTVLKYGW